MDKNATVSCVRMVKNATAVSCGRMDKNAIVSCGRIDKNATAVSCD